jgi:hypothetical protein
MYSHAALRSVLFLGSNRIFATSGTLKWAFCKCLYIFEFNLSQNKLTCHLLYLQALLSITVTFSSSDLFPSEFEDVLSVILSRSVAIPSCWQASPEFSLDTYHEKHRSSWIWHFRQIHTLSDPHKHTWKWYTQKLWIDHYNYPSTKIMFEKDFYLVYHTFLTCTVKYHDNLLNPRNITYWHYHYY